MAESHDSHAKPFDAAHDVDNVSTVFLVYLIVVGLSGATIGLSLLGLGKLALPVQMAISTVQAVVVSYFWMHLRRNDKVITLTALAAIFWTGILFVLFMADFATRWSGGL